MSQTPKIIYTHTDEAPALATYSFLPIVRAFSAKAGIEVDLQDISLAGRVLANFPQYLNEDQKLNDALSELGELTQDPHVNIIKLPNISASVPQLKACVAELQAQGFALPNYPEEPQNDIEKAVKATYDKIKGSAVNPVLREGNSDRRAPKAVKEYARSNPHRMGAWSSDSVSHVSSMSHGDFFANEQSCTLDQADHVRIEHVDAHGVVKVLKPDFAIEAQEVIDSTFMSAKALVEFLSQEVVDAQEKGILFSLHMKATMMKISDPIIFGHAVKVYFKDVFTKYAKEIEDLGVDVNNGFGDLLSKIESLPEATQIAIKADIKTTYERQASLAMVDSDRGITNLHVPSDVIIDASMPAMIRDSGRMWNGEGNTQDAKAVIPDRSYAGVYQTVVEFCQTHGAFDPCTMGNVPNVGLMAKKAEEYGSHDKTFEIHADGEVRIVNSSGHTLMSHQVEAGDIWRMCQVKDAPVQDWVKLAVNRARATGSPTVFWLDQARAHDSELITKVETYLKDHNTEGLELHIMSPVEATRFTLTRLKEGQNTISVTGNVLRDYLTDLFPILELGTSAKMLSIVPLMKGGGLFETGAGGSAPKHVQQFNKENHLRWDSLGEFLALAVSLEHVSQSYQHPSAKVLGETLDQATTSYLLNNKSPSRKVNELDNRGSHFYVAMYWAQALANQDQNASLKEAFAPIASALQKVETQVVAELNEVQGQAMDIGGYYNPNPALATKAMRPSATLNQIIDALL
jgi:isocitrate dehydrogenase